MSDQSLELRPPELSFRDEFGAFVREFAAEGEDAINGDGGMSRRDFDAGVQCCADQARGVNLPERWVPTSTFWLVKNGVRIVGTVNIRHYLDAWLELYGGHIGYSIRPSDRRKGYATRMLAMALDVAKNMGLQRVLLTCDRDNIASARVIQKNGGVMENEVMDEKGIKTIQRYWMAL